MKYKLISLDTSSSSTGWSYFEDGRYVESGIINLKHIKDTQNRIRQMVIEINELIDHYSPACVVIETPVVVRNPLVQRILTMIFGSVYSMCVIKNITWAELRPTEWRKYIDSGKKPRKRDELKEWSIHKVFELFNKDVTDDESDAILIGQAYINMWNAGGE